jgi:phosphoribulokinase
MSGRTLAQENSVRAVRKRRERPIMIGIVGDSGAGKTTFAAGLAEVLGRDQALVICIDDYHRYSRKERTVNGLTPHDPLCNYLDILEQHIDLLREGEPILKPIYNHAGGVLEPPTYVTPQPFIILEGLHGYATPRLREHYDLKFYMEPQEQLRLRWKFQRDTGPGGFGYTVEQAMALLPRLNRDSALYIAPQRGYADMVVSFYAPDKRLDESGEGLNVRHILRPTLPYVDLAPLLEAGAEGGLELELARDVDGRPADALHIFGGMSRRQADALQDHLWRLLPASHLARPRVGAFRDEHNALRYSNSLALSQLLIAHYLLNAAIDAHAT